MGKFYNTNYFGKFFCIENLYEISPENNFDLQINLL